MTTPKLATDTAGTHHGDDEATRTLETYSDIIAYRRDARLGAALRVLSADKAVVISHDLASTQIAVHVGLRRNGFADTLDAAVELAMQGEGRL